MRIFISQPMKGKSDEQILEERNQAITKIKAMDIFKDQDIEIIDSILSEETRSKAHNVKHPRVYNLGESLKLLATADCLVLMPGFNKAEGCLIEGIIARLYDIEVIKV